MKVKLWTYQSGEWRSYMAAPSVEPFAYVKGVELTDRQSQLLGFIVLFTDIHNYSPTIRQMVEYVGYASNTPVDSLLQHLERKHCIERLPGESRNIRLIRKPWSEYFSTFYEVFYQIHFLNGGFLSSRNKRVESGSAMRFPSRQMADIKLAWLRSHGVKASMRIEAVKRPAIVELEEAEQCLLV